MELGIYTFAELTPDPATGHTMSAQQRLRDLVEEIKLADQVGLDVLGVGEHHRPTSRSRRPPWSSQPGPSARRVSASRAR